MLRRTVLLLALAGCLRELPIDPRGFDCAADGDCGGLQCVAGRCLDPARPELRWRPPALNQPVTVELGTGKTDTKLDDDRDYIVRLPRALKEGATSIDGGRNVVILGGELMVAADAASDSELRTLYLKDIQGVVHIEGLLLRGRPEVISHAFVLASPNAIVQIEGVRVVDLHGGEGKRGWAMTAWGGARELRIDRFYASSSSGALDLHDTVVGPVTLSRVDLTARPTSADEGTKLLLYLRDTCDGSGYSFSNLFLSPGSRALLDVVSPGPSASECPAQMDEDGAAVWPGANISGRALQGPPPRGAFVPEAAAGIHYVSPGYLPE